MAVVVLVLAHVCSMLGFSTYAALLPQLRDAFGLTNAQAGIVGGGFFAGYVATVSFWTSRADARRVYGAGSLVAALGSAGFALFAHGFASALAAQMVLGAGIAGTYMPGLRLLSDRVHGPAQSRSIAFYTASFGIGTALSLALAGAVASAAGAKAAFLAAAAGPVVAGALVFAFVEPLRSQQAVARPALSILKQRDAVGYILGYAVHCLELFGSRGWMVAFLTFSSAAHAFPWRLQSIAAVVNLLSVPASIAGNEVALRIGRRRWILLAMAASGASGMIVGASAGWHWAVVVALLAGYSILVMADSATLTAGLVAAAPPELRGSALGLYSLAGFGGGMLGPVVFGAALDATGGAADAHAWIAAYAAIGAGCLLAPALVRLES